MRIMYGGVVRLNANFCPSGYLTAQFNIGVNYFSGLGVEHDFKKAAYYFDLAARRGHVPAQVRHRYLSYLYFVIYTSGICYMFVLMESVKT